MRLSTVGHLLQDANTSIFFLFCKSRDAGHTNDGYSWILGKGVLECRIWSFTNIKCRRMSSDSVYVRCLHFCIAFPVYLLPVRTLDCCCIVGTTPWLRRARSSGAYVDFSSELREKQKDEKSATKRNLVLTPLHTSFPSQCCGLWTRSWKLGRRMPEESLFALLSNPARSESFINAGAICIAIIIFLFFYPCFPLQHHTSQSESWNTSSLEKLGWR